LQRVWFRSTEEPSGDDASFGEDLGEDSEEIDSSLVGVSHLTRTFFGTTVHGGNYHGGRLKMQESYGRMGETLLVFLQPLGTTASRISKFTCRISAMEGNRID
jgi:hypothetical protein